jgi:fused signal recognition particle receptor
VGFLQRLKDGLKKTKEGFVDKVTNIFTGRTNIDDELFEELEEVLIQADVGVKTTFTLIDKLKDDVEKEEITEPEELMQYFQKELKSLLQNDEGGFNFDKDLNIIMVVGVNGAGKTTTIAKIAGRIAQQEGSDAAAVAYDAVQSARAKGVDLLIVDTAGRLHTQTNLMEELKKVKRVIDREAAEIKAGVEVLLVLDATTGQNAISQAKLFNDAVNVDGIALTKLDGTAKGGIVIAVKNELQIPIKLIGVGEAAEDLQNFDPDEFIKALFSSEE